MRNATSGLGTRWLQAGDYRDTTANRGADRWDDPNEEPALDEIFSDPVVRAVMCRDGLDPSEVRSFMVATARRLSEADEMAPLPHPPLRGAETGCCA